MYDNGKGVPQNYKTAVKWYRLAAKQGDAFAQYNLGNMYNNGDGVSQDNVYAHMWYNIAASSGDKDAIKNRDIVAKKMTSSQLAKSQDLARNFVPTKSSPVVTAIKSPPPSPSAAEIENEKLRRENARLKKNQQSKPKKIAKKKPQSTPKSSTSGSGFFISKSGHVITNQHVVDNCKQVTIGDNAKKQVTADVLETDRRNDLALLKVSSMQMASAETKSLIRKLGIKIVPLASEGLLRSDDVELGEDVLVSGYPYGELFSNSIKVTKGIVSANKGMGDDSGQFQIDAAVQPGNSGGPIYDENGNIVGVVVAQLNKMKFAKTIGSMPENVNFGIKGSTVRQFLTSSGLPTKWSKRSKRMNTRELAKIAKNQTVMVMCHQ
jgi:S1-C subfamily serine protease